LACALAIDELTAVSRERMASYETRRSTERVEAPPPSVAGKVLKREMRSPYWDASCALSTDRRSGSLAASGVDENQAGQSHPPVTPDGEGVMPKVSSSGG
jgi:hypothetical protein